MGCGDVGRRLARRLIEQGQNVVGWVQSADSVQALRKEGIDARQIDLDRLAPDIRDSQIYWFAPPPKQGLSDPRLRRWIDGLDFAPRRVVYISTTGVYGDCGQRWIDEDEPLNPKSDRARRRLDAEQALQRAPAGLLDAVILRVPGIYGPGRLPIARLRKALPVVDEPDAPRWTNRIHSEDLADAALAAMHRGLPGRAYNISDGHPSTMSDYFTRCARLLKLPEPRRITMAEAEAELSPQMLSFVSESRRISNRRMIEELGYRPRYQDLQGGLPSCL